MPNLSFHSMCNLWIRRLLSKLRCTVQEPPMNDTRHPRSAPGDFFVAAASCISCMAPEHEAPDLMQSDNDGCYFHKQPESMEETERASRAVWVSCCGAVQYAGSDSKILARLKELERSKGYGDA